MFLHGLNLFDKAERVYFLHGCVNIKMLCVVLINFFIRPGIDSFLLYIFSRVHVLCCFWSVTFSPVTVKSQDKSVQCILFAKFFSRTKINIKKEINEENTDVCFFKSMCVHVPLIILLINHRLLSQCLDQLILQWCSIYDRVCDWWLNLT